MKNPIFHIRGICHFPALLRPRTAITGKGEVRYGLTVGVSDDEISRLVKIDSRIAGRVRVPRVLDDIPRKVVNMQTQLPVPMAFEMGIDMDKFNRCRDLNYPIDMLFINADVEVITEGWNYETSHGRGFTLAPIHVNFLSRIDMDKFDVSEWRNRFPETAAETVQ